MPVAIALSGGMVTRASYRVGLLLPKILGAVACLLLVACYAASLQSKQYWPVAIFGFYALIGVYLILASGAYEISASAVRHQNAFGQFEMRWQDITKIEIGTQGTLVLHAIGARFVLAPPALWSGADKRPAIELLKRALDALAVPIIRCDRADFKIHKGVKTVSRPAGT